MHANCAPLVYHFTDSARLPWILQSGALRPGRNKLGGFPDPDLLWATTSPIGDRTASAAGSQAFRSGLVRLVRFTLRTIDFIRWPDCANGFPAWTPSQIERLEKAAANMGERDGPSRWYGRAAPLPRSSWLNVEVRSYTDRAWRAFDVEAPVVAYPRTPERGVVIGGFIFMSQQIDHGSGAGGYLAREPIPVESVEALP